MKMTILTSNLCNRNKHENKYVKYLYAEFYVYCYEKCLKDLDNWKHILCLFLDKMFRNVH